MGTQTVAAIPTWTWAVPLIAALIAFGGVTLTIVLQWRNFTKQLRSAHALKVAEMRQAWINSLRDAMSKFQSYGVTPGIAHISEREFYEYGTRIELLMNPKDPDYQKLHDCLYKFLSADDVLNKFSANPDFINVCQRILKREWDTLKREIAAAA